MVSSICIVLAQALNDPTAQANIHASQVTSRFASDMNPSNYYKNREQDKLYSIGSSQIAIVPTANDIIDGEKSNINDTAHIENIYYTNYTVYNIYNSTQVNQSTIKQTESRNNFDAGRDSESIVDENEDLSSRIGGNSPKQSTSTVAGSYGDQTDEDDFTDGRGKMKSFDHIK